MKPTVLLSGAFLLLHLGLYAQSQHYTLKIEKATVFVKGAELQSTVKVNLQKGENELVLTNVAGDVNNSSITVGATGGVVTESVTFQNDYTDSTGVSPRVKLLKDSIEAAEGKRSIIANKVAALAEQITIIQANRKIGGSNTNLSTVELQKMLDFTAAKMETLLNQKDKNEKELKKMDERLAALKEQLDVEQQKEYQPGGQIRVKLLAKETSASALTITYVVGDAGWTPIYDIWADGSKQPVKFYYKANVYQNSGVSWDKVHIALSTGNPQEGMQAPTLNPWYISFYTPPVEQEHIQYFMKKGVTRNSIYTLSDSNEATGSSYTWSGNQAPTTPSSLNEFVAVDNGGVNTTFDIDLPYTIPSDGQEHLVAVKQYEVPATYEYFAVPKEDNDAFLLARITNWQELNLLPGKTNIFYENTYVGEGNIDTRNTGDTLSLSLGRDKKIVIKKERDKNLRSKKMIGANERQQFAYTVTIRNTRKEPVSIVVLDQLPVSTDNDLSVEDIETGNAEHNETTGTLKWAISLNGNETKTLHFGFTLKYPKGKTISNMPR